MYAYAQLVKKGELNVGDPLRVVGPTGNFGNILAAYYAKQMGVAIEKLICASNENKVLFDFFTTGTYDRKREFILTTSPSMDILISSNLERLIYQIAGSDEEKNRELMRELSENGAYTITDEMKAQLKDFAGGYATEEQTAQTIHDLYEKTGYVIDTHTSVAATVCKAYNAEHADGIKTLIASTASPYKFTRSVMNAIDPKYDDMTDFELIDELSVLSKTKIPQAIEDIRSAPVLHKTVAEVDGMEAAVNAFLQVK